MLNRFSTRPVALAALMLIALVAGACRPLAIETEPSPVYMVDVRNTLAQPLVVQFDDGRGPRLLGTVPAGALERFVIAAPATAEVAIIGVSEDGARTVRRDVVLQRGVAVNVALGS